ncbi:Hypothetical protein KVN_LOCUS366 [uncultured virus]|nr:Hypothetical protein KVN_LOCUS366 [uncultured virus]
MEWKFSSEIDKFFETKKNYIDQFIDLDNNFDFKFSKNNNGKNIIEINDINKKLILKAEFQVVGIYNLINSVWYWGSNIQFIDKNLVTSVIEFKKKLKEKLLNDNNYIFENQKEKDEMFFYVSNENFFISPKNIMKLIKITLFYTKSIWFFTIYYGKDGNSCLIDSDKEKFETIKRLEYIIITKIIQIG